MKPIIMPLEVQIAGPCFTCGAHLEHGVFCEDRQACLFRWSLRERLRLMLRRENSTFKITDLMEA